MRPLQNKTIRPFSPSRDIMTVNVLNGQKNLSGDGLLRQTALFCHPPAAHGEIVPPICFFPAPHALIAPVSETKQNGPSMEPERTSMPEPVARVRFRSDRNGHDVLTLPVKAASFPGRDNGEKPCAIVVPALFSPFPLFRNRGIPAPEDFFRYGTYSRR